MKRIYHLIQRINCIGGYHYQHTQYHPSHDKENILDLVQTEVVMSVPIGKLFDEYDVTELLSQDRY